MAFLPLPLIHATHVPPSAAEVAAAVHRASAPAMPGWPASVPVVTPDVRKTRRLGIAASRTGPTTLESGSAAASSGSGPASGRGAAWPSTAGAGFGAGSTPRSWTPMSVPHAPTALERASRAQR